MKPSSAPYWFWGPLLTISLLIYFVTFTHSNQQVFLWLNRLPFSTGDTLWACLTLGGNGFVSLTLLLPWMRRRPDVVRTAIVALLLTGLTVEGLKLLFRVPRPPALLSPHTFHLIGVKNLYGAFPSGRIASMFALVNVWCFAVSRTWMRIMFLILAVLVGIARVVVGVHWPLDVLAGAMIGWGIAQGVRVVITPYSWGTQAASRRRFLGLLLIAAFWLLCIHDTGYPQALFFQRALAIICCLWAGIDLLRNERTQC